MCQLKSFNSSTTPRASFSFAWPIKPIYLNTPTNPTDSFAHSTNSTRSTRANQTISPLAKARTDNSQADIFPQDIAIDMNVEEKPDDLMDVIAKFEKMKIVDDMDWEAI